MTYTKLPITKIQISDANPRKAFDEDSILGLAQSIKTDGLLQNLIVGKANRRVGNDFMDEEEYEFHAIGVWSFWVFIAAAFFTGYNLQEFIPDEWPKWARFTSTIIPAVIVGGILGALGIFIRIAFFFALTWGVIGLVLYWIWQSI